MNNYSDVKMVVVEQDSFTGFWEIDFDNNVARFREYEHRKLRSNQEKMHDWSEIYDSIEEYLTRNQGYKYTKELIPNRKVVFSTNEPFCSTCIEKATVYRNGNPYCNAHANLKNL
jgi:hypothetical protein